ncbi:MAG: formate dehydrogenase accessory protein FdhE [Desulfitobacterium hafniense]|nr:formate dehydrogenase accessory protein FdhE [Desulfitobacterium hafniense]
MEKQLQEAHRMYHSLKEEVKSWQEKDGIHWIKELRPRSTRPYFPLFDLPEEPVLELWQRLQSIIGMNVTEADLRHQWHEFKHGREISDPETLSNLQLAFGGVAELARGQLLPEQIQALGLSEESSRCPVCGEEIRLSLLVEPVGKRHLHCIMCRYEWSTKRVGCVRCGSENASKQIYLHTEEFPGVEMVVCQDCGQPFKEIDLRKVSVDDLVWKDVSTLPLNYAAEQWLAENAKEAGKIQ